MESFPKKQTTGGIPAAERSEAAIAKATPGEKRLRPAKSAIYRTLENRSPTSEQNIVTPERI